jgi:hypothetical protein
MSCHSIYVKEQASLQVMENMKSENIGTRHVGVGDLKSLYSLVITCPPQIKMFLVQGDLKPLLLDGQG